MTLEGRSGFLGLVTNTADLQAPPGALERAKNVVIRRAGACETRPGVDALYSKSNTQQTVRLIPYETETVAANANNEWWNQNDDQAILYPPPDGAASFAPTQFRADLIPAAQTRGNLYVGTAVGVLKFNGVPDATTGNDMFITTGVPLNLLVTGIVATIVGGFLPTGNQVAYALVAVKTDANGLVTRSRPTGARYVANALGSAARVQLTITSQYPTRLYDKIEIYRTRTFPSSVTPDEEMQLVGEVVPTSSTTVVFDNLADANRGSALYTSPSRDGAEGANDRAPACGALAVFKGALFCGNTIGPERAIISFVYGGTALAGVATGIGVRTYNSTITIGSANITAVASTVGLQKGMRITDNAGVDYFDGGHIINIAGATVTMSKVATASTAPATPILYHDAITLDGGATWLYAPAIVGAGSPVTNLYTSYRVVPPIGGYTSTFVVESLLSGSLANLAIKATHGDEYLPALPLYDSSAYTGTQDTLPNGLSWSKPDEPEHFPPANFALVGDKKRAILGLVATRDALFIFKEDGIWRLTGVNGQYRIDPFDLTTFCILPGSVVALKNRIFMLSNKGVVAVSDEGVEIVSLPIADQLRKLIYDLQTGALAGNGYAIPLVGYAGMSVERDNEYMLLTGSALANERSQIVNGGIVFNDVTKAWTSWEWTGSGGMAVTPTTWAWNERQGYGVIAQQGGTRFKNYLMIAPPAYPTPVYPGYPWAGDARAALTLSTVVGNTITYAPPTLLAVGDVIVDAGSFKTTVVTAVNSSASVVVADASTMSGGESVTALRPITCTVRPRAFMSPQQAMKHWTQFVAEFSYLSGANTASVGAISSIMTNTSTMAVTPVALDIVAGNIYECSYQLGYQLRAVLPVQAARGLRMLAEVTWAGAWGGATLETIFVEALASKTNVPNLAVRSGP